MLIFIQHDQAGPNLPSNDVIHPLWIRWPTDQTGLNNRILALACGVDLQGEAADMKFRPAGDGLVSGNGRRLQARGFFAARAAYLGGVPVTVIENRDRGLSPHVTFLGLTDPEMPVRAQPFGAPLPAGGVSVYEALGWDDATAVAQRAERALVVEYPTPGPEGWGRFWLKRRWPGAVPVESDLGVPGLVRARRAMALLVHPESFRWTANDAIVWGGPNRWLEHGQKETPILLGLWAAGVTFVIAWGLAQVMNEDRGPFVSQMLVLAALSPASSVLAGSAARAVGLEAWPVLLVFATAGTYGASLLAGYVVRRTAPEAHPLWPVCLVGLLSLVLFDPLWSELSGRFAGFDVDVPGLALGAFVGYLAGAMAFAPGRGFGRALALAALLWGVTARPWWIDGHSALLTLPAVALLAAEGLFRPSLLLVLALLPTNLVRIAREGIAWNTGGLLAFADQGKAWDLWLEANLLVSPEWIGFLAFAALVGLIGNRFLAYRLRKLLRLDPRLRALPWVTLGALALGITEPLAIPVAPVLAYGALIALAFDGLRANA